MLVLNLTFFCEKIINQHVGLLSTGQDGWLCSSSLPGMVYQGRYRVGWTWLKIVNLCALIDCLSTVLLLSSNVFNYFVSTKKSLPAVISTSVLYSICSNGECCFVSSCGILLTSSHFTPFSSSHSHSPFALFSSSDVDDSGLVDVYDNQCHVWVPGIQPGAPATQLLRVLVGPCTYKYHCSLICLPRIHEVCPQERKYYISQLKKNEILNKHSVYCHTDCHLKVMM